jgi:hypothetical protein
VFISSIIYIGIYYELGILMYWNSDLDIGPIYTIKLHILLTRAPFLAICGCVLPARSYSKVPLRSAEVPELAALNLILSISLPSQSSHSCQRLSPSRKASKSSDRNRDVQIRHLLQTSNDRLSAIILQGWWHSHS